MAGGTEAADASDAASPRGELLQHADGSEQLHVAAASDSEALSLLDGGAGMGSSSSSSSAVAELQRLRCMLDKERAERRAQQGRANRLRGALVKARAAGAAFAAAAVARVASAAAGAQADAAVAAAEAAAKVQSEACAHDARMRRAAKRTAAAAAAAVAAAESEPHPECGGDNTSGALLPAAAAACAQWEWEERALVAEERLAEAAIQLAALRGAANTMHAACRGSSLLVAVDAGATTTLTAAPVRAQRQNAAEDQPQLLAVGTGSGAPNTATVGRREVNVHATSVLSVPTCRSVPQLAIGSNGNGKPQGARRTVHDGPLLGTALPTSQIPTGRTSASKVQLARKRTQTHNSRQRPRSPSRSTADFFAGSSRQ